MIKNYTSGVPASRSIAMIEQMLVDNGATNVVKQYDDTKRCCAIIFQIPSNGQIFPIALRARISDVAKELRKAVKRPRPDTEARIREQAERCAWKIEYDWCAIQFTKIHLGKAEFLEVFLPYIFDPSKGSSFYESLSAGGFRLLTEHK
jgi:hypothetical protein